MMTATDLIEEAREEHAAERDRARAKLLSEGAAPATVEAIMRRAQQLHEEQVGRLALDLSHFMVGHNAGLH